RLRRLPFVPVGLTQPEQRGAERWRDAQRPPEGVDGRERLLLIEQDVCRTGDRLDAARLQPERLVVELLGLGGLTVLDRAVTLADQLVVTSRARLSAVLSRRRSRGRRRRGLVCRRRCSRRGRRRRGRGR